MQTKLIRRVLIILVAILAYDITSAIPMIPTYLHWRETAMSGIALAFLAYGLLIFWLWRRVRAFTANVTPPDDNSGIGLQKLKAMIPGAIILFLTQAISAYATMVQSIPESQNQQTLTQLFTENSAVMFISTTLFAPIVEELIFRGLLMNLAFTERTRNNQLFNFILSIGAFSLAHTPTSIIDFVIYAALGAGMALTYVKTRDLRCGIILHILNNVAAALI